MTIHPEGPAKPMNTSISYHTRVLIFLISQIAVAVLRYLFGPNYSSPNQALGAYLPIVLRASCINIPRHLVPGTTHVCHFITSVGMR